jgi:hypothetical protein
MVRMAKSWNRTKNKIIKPSFLIDIMALDILRPPFGGDFPYEFMAFFATMADRIGDDWPEPFRGTRAAGQRLDGRDGARGGGRDTTSELGRRNRPDRQSP